MAGRQWITPFQRQCFVVVGASINMSQIGLVMGFAAILLPQLRAENSEIQINDTSGSWIASLPGFALLIGNLIVPTIMAKLGRRWANLISIAIVVVGWVCIVVAQDVTLLLVARLLQGISAGMSYCLIPILIGEYTSPKTRGAFMFLMSLIMATATLTVHALGSYCTWKITALVMAIISLINMFVVVLSPETPSWLAGQKKFEECERVFRRLRGDEEIEELHKLIQNNTETNTRQCNISRSKGYISTLKKKEFYKPIIIMIHLYIMGQWGGICILAPFVVEIVSTTCGYSEYTALIVVSVDIQRVISSVFAVFMIRRMKRRTMLFMTCGMNALILLVTAGYVYAKSNKILSLDHPWIGIFLVHALMMTIAIGSLPMPLTIAGEIFALKYKSLSNGFCSLIGSVNLFLAVKTFLFLTKTIGLHGAYCLYAGIMIYCLIVASLILPETKDRSLQDIEDEFRGHVVDDDLKATEPLTNR